MKYIEEENGIRLIKPENFIISQTLECGQCFNFNKISDENYVVIAYEKLLHIYSEDNDIIFAKTTLQDFENIWIKYFDLDRDYAEIVSKLSKKDEIIKAAIDYAPGIRIINQEFFQCLVSFIISQNNRIPRIKKIVNNLSRRYGEYIDTIEGEEYFSFPLASKLYGVTAEELMESNTGFRGKYIVDAVNKYVEECFKETELQQLTTVEIREELMKIKGVGPKVADCVILFSLEKRDAFPTDVWVKRVMSYFYFNQNDTAIKEIHDFANKAFGSNAGYAQQYLFNYARNFKIK